MTTPSKLDEARLRELAVRCQKAKRDNARWEALDALENACTPATILALLDALSAERERGDRAVGLLREAVPETLTYEGEPDDVERASWTSNGLRRRTEAFLATQKAEGAET